MEYKREQEIATMLANAMYEKIMQEGIIDEIIEINPKDLADLTFKCFFPKILNAEMIYAHNSGKYDENELKAMEIMNTLVQMIDSLKDLDMDEENDQLLEGNIMIDENTKKRAIQMYRKGELKTPEICNLLDISYPSLYRILRQYRKNANIERRTNEKLTYEQEKQIAEDYYINNLKIREIKNKYNIHPQQLQRIRNKFSKIYGKKKMGRPLKRKPPQNNAI